MRVGIFSIHDSAAAAFLQPFFAGNETVAKRSFSQAINEESEQNSFFKHFQDYSLFSVGYFDDQTGEITPEKPQHLGNGATFKRETL